MILKADHTGLDAVCYDIMLVASAPERGPSEIVALQPSRIKRSPISAAQTPLFLTFEVRADGRKLKTKNALRNIPLVGVGLAAMSATRRASRVQ